MHIRKSNSIFLILILTASILGGCMQENAEQAVKETTADLKTADIRQDEMLKHIEELTSDKYKGRMVGTEGNRLAEDYIENNFIKLGLKNPSGIKGYKQYYKQGVILLKEKPVLQIVDGAGKVASDFDYVDDFVIRRLSSQTTEVSITAPLFLLERADMLSEKDIDLKGKILLIPSKFGWLAGKPDFPTDLSVKCNASAVICEFDLSNNAQGLKYLRVTPFQESWRQPYYNPFIFTESNAFAKLAEAEKKGMKVSFKSQATPLTYVDAANVVGIIPGTDPEYEYSYIVIGAHFDHVGDNMDGTYNAGALDNASGPAAMLEIARIIKENPIAPKRPIAFIGFNGESSGFLGSSHFTSHPLFSLGKAVMINLDMVGASADVKLMLARAPVSGKDMNAPMDDLSRYSEELGIDYYTSFTGGSDHVSFAELGVPSVLIIHPDYANGYHSPHDTIEDISGDRLEEVVRLVLHYMEEYAY
ncbi:MAG TPA: M28 family metallopeptidase [Clostridia bacterium]|nr:M28 family metallopeptidase [Clostridia bacterium]